VVRSAFRLALASAHVKASAVEIGEFPRLSQQLGVRAVPYTVFNGRSAIAGAMDEAALAEAIVKAAGGAESAHAQGGATSEASPAGAQPPSGLVIPR
jgi:predicted DsbA family dithiol-disulfide isomerase